MSPATMLTFNRTVFCSDQLYLIALLIVFKITLKTSKSNAHTRFSKRVMFFPLDLYTIRLKWYGYHINPRPWLHDVFVFLLGWAWRHNPMGQLTEDVSSPHLFSDWSRLLLYDWLLLSGLLQLNVGGLWACPYSQSWSGMCRLGKKRVLKKKKKKYRCSEGGSGRPSWKEWLISDRYSVPELTE